MGFNLAYIGLNEETGRQKHNHPLSGFRTLASQIKQFFRVEIDLKEHN
jgi:hypothetical protein